MIWFIHSAQQEPTPSSSRAAIVSVVIGETYEAMWGQLCAASWIAYVERMGFDLIVFKARLDPADARSPAWQKLLILALPWMQRYERVVWLDSDIIISPGAPDILEFAGPPEKVGLVLEGARLSPAEQQVYLERLHKMIAPPDSLDYLWSNSQIAAYHADGLPPHGELYNTGVMVLSPRHHTELLRGVYECPERTRLYEQAHLSHLLIEGGLAHEISPRFNWGIMESMRLYLDEEVLAGLSENALGGIVTALVRAEMRNAYFLHFYGAMNLLKLFMRPPVEAAA
jgi:hypothetical protein